MVKTPFPSPSFYREIIHKWKLFRTAINLPRSGQRSKLTPWSEHAENLQKTTRAKSQGLQASISMLNINVHDSKNRN